MCAGTPSSETPSISICPEVCGITLEMTRSSEVLPAPFGPMTAIASPACTSSETSNSAWKAP